MHSVEMTIADRCRPGIYSIPWDSIRRLRVYNLGSPGLAAVDMKMSNGKHLRMTTGNWSARNVFVKEVYLNGKKYDKSYITYNDIKDGADLHFVMSSRPNYKRGVAERAVPPSVSEKR